MRFRTPIRRFAAFLLIAWAIAPAFAADSAAVDIKNLRPIFTRILIAQGDANDSKKLQTSSRMIDLAWLSDDLLLVAMRSYPIAPVMPLQRDTPPGNLLLFDVNRGDLVGTASYGILNSPNSVQATRDGHFAILGEAGIRICSTDLSCGTSLPIPGSGPLAVSPKGTKILVGGNGQRERWLLDSAFLERVATFPHDAHVIPGDDGYAGRLPGQEGLLLNHSGTTTAVHLVPTFDRQFVEEAFIDDETFLVCDGHTSLVSIVNGSEAYRLSIMPEYDGTVIKGAPRANRFFLYQVGYRHKGLGNLFHDFPLGDESAKPKNIASLRIFQTDSGKEQSNLEWDPRPNFGVGSPFATSPDGSKFALVRHGALEVYLIR